MKVIRLLFLLKIDLLGWKKNLKSILKRNHHEIKKQKNITFDI